MNLGIDGAVQEAGAFLVQVLPGAEPREVDLVHANIQHLQSLAAQLSSNPNPVQLLGQIFNDLVFVIIEEKPLKFECNCSRDRVIRALKMVSKAELLDMAAKDKGAKVSCDFCGTTYAVSEEELIALVAGKAG